MFNKILVLTITRIFELVILYALVSWLWSTIGASLGIAIILGVIAVYCIYLGVTLSNDYHELKFGVGEPME